eukprot:CAMPEP_0116565334 /NCGR_PEP_ID=MMETSP0397-20121206/13841_1 /TAXON_ID=216820 /ORGANISM="Cyclophora tenuis, Strain ECT3854" /LENGTH=339 /DNA_ID=CAMNT_0004092097 /DNA_START=21 /DNA_END=1040 /DNA_ORIENTATION=-
MKGDMTLTGGPQSPLQLQQMLQQMATASSTSPQFHDTNTATPAVQQHLKQPSLPGQQQAAPGQLPDAMMRLHHQMGGSPSLQEALSLSHHQRALLNQNLTNAAAQAAAAAALAIGQFQQHQQQQAPRPQQSASVAGGMKGGQLTSTAADSSTRTMESANAQQSAAVSVASVVSAAKQQGAAGVSEIAPAPQSVGAPAGTAAPALPFPPGAFPQLAALGNPATTLAAAAHLQTLQQQHGAEGVDPNAYMRAAIDMLLRYASTSAGGAAAAAAAAAGVGVPVGVAGVPAPAGPLSPPPSVIPTPPQAAAPPGPAPGLGAPGVGAPTPSAPPGPASSAPPPL